MNVGASAPSVDGDSTPSPSIARFADQLRAARRGCRQTKGDLLQQCRDYLLAAARRRLGEDLQAKVGASDLVQETLAEACERFDHFAGDTAASLLAWLTRILEYNALSAQRRYAQTKKRDVAREVSFESASGNGVDAAPLLTPSPHARLEAAEEERDLRAALDRLIADDRRVIELRNFELLSFSEIGRRMDRTADGARKLWARAMGRLTLLLRADGPNTG